jgi:hypothetical protein
MYHNILVCENFTSPETKMTRDFTGEFHFSIEFGISPHDTWLGIGGNLNVCPAGTSITDVISTDDWYIGACCPPSHPIGGETQRNSKVPVCCKGHQGHSGCGPKSGERIWPDWPVECATTYGWTAFQRVDKINAGISPAMSHGCEWCRDARKQKCINGTGIFNREVDHGGEEDPKASVQDIHDVDDASDVAIGNTCSTTSKMVDVLDGYNHKIQACCPLSNPVGGESAYKSRVPVWCKGAEGKVGCPHEAGECVWPEHSASCAQGIDCHLTERVDEFNRKPGNGMGFGHEPCYDEKFMNCVDGTVPDPNLADDSQPATKMIDTSLVARSDPEFEVITNAGVIERTDEFNKNRDMGTGCESWNERKYKNSIYGASLDTSLTDRSAPNSEVLADEDFTAKPDIASSGDFIDAIAPNTNSKAGLPSANECPSGAKLVNIISTAGYKMSSCCPPEAPVGAEANNGGDTPVCCKEVKGKKGCPKESWPLQWPLKPVSCNEARGWGMFQRVDEVNKDIGKSWGCMWCADPSKCGD